MFLTGYEIGLLLPSCLIGSLWLVSVLVKAWKKDKKKKEEEEFEKDQSVAYECLVKLLTMKKNEGI